MHVILIHNAYSPTDRTEEEVRESERMVLEEI
jgi:hypothetical protein